MKDTSDWQITGYGESSTLEKIELLSPNEIPYVMKFPRTFNKDRTNWEDVNEIIASKIANLLDIDSVDAEIAYYKGRRGCLMLHFKFQYEADVGETLASLLSSEFGQNYKDIHFSGLPNQDRMYKFMEIFERFSYYSLLKETFVYMNLFDILVGNQDRHAHNWQILFKNEEKFPAPLYDNGASLGWQLSEQETEIYMNSEQKMESYFKKTTTKIGLDNIESPKIKANTFLMYLKSNYPSECSSFLKKLDNFSHEEYNDFIDEFPLITNNRKQFLLKLVYYRVQRLTQILREVETK